MTLLPPDICLRLRDAGLPQPEIAIGQFWYLTRYPGGTLKNHVLSVVIQHYSHAKNLTLMPLDNGDNPNQHLKIFCPAAQYILDHLPDTLKIEKYNKQWMLMVKGEYQLKDTLLEAAALAYLHIHEKTPAPLP